MFHRTLLKQFTSLGILVLAGCTTLDSSSPDSNIQSERRTISDAPRLSKIDALTRPKFIENENQPDGLTQELLYDLLLSSIAYQTGEVDAASNALARAAFSTNEPELVSRAARMALHIKNYQLAFKLGQQWIAVAPLDFLAHTITALGALLDKKEQEAFDVLDAYFQQDSLNRSERIELVSDVLLRRPETSATFSLIKKLVAQYPEETSAWMALAGIAQRNENVDEMRAGLRQVLKLDPSHQNAAVYLLSTFVSDAQAQQQFADAFIKQNPDAQTFRLQYARLLMRQEENKSALKVLLSLLEKDKAHSEANNLVAVLYQADEKYAQAVKYFKLRLKSMPGDDRTRIYMASALEKLSRYDEAKTVLADVKDSEEIFDSKRQMAVVIENADGIDAALDYLSSLVGKDKDERIQLIVDEELLLKRADREDEALDVINTGLALYPDSDTLRYHRALLKIDQNNIQAHEQDMRILIKRTPDNAHYQNTLGYTLLTLTDRLEDAAVLIDKAHELKPNDPFILDSKGWLEFKKGAYETAIKFLQMAFDLDQDAEIAAHIGEVYWVQGDEQKAKETWAQGEEIDSENKALLETKKRLLN